jgi:hypothetical protein
MDVEPTSGEGWEEACRHQVGQHARDVLEGLPARVRTREWREDRGEDEPPHAPGEQRLLSAGSIQSGLLWVRANEIFVAGPQEAGEEVPPVDEEARQRRDVYRGPRRRPADQLDHDEAEVHAWPAADPAQPLLPARYLLRKPPFSAPEAPL